MKQKFIPFLSLAKNKYILHIQEKPLFNRSGFFYVHKSNLKTFYTTKKPLKSSEPLPY